MGEEEEEEDVLLTGGGQYLTLGAYQVLDGPLGMVRALDDGSFFVLRESQQQG